MSIAMLRIAVCDDSRTDVKMLEAAFDELPYILLNMMCILAGKLNGIF